LTQNAPKYWLDSNVLITAKDGAFRFSVAPGFWSALDRFGRLGQIQITKLVYEELVHDEPTDDLAKWLKARRLNGFCITPDQDVQNELQKIADHVYASYARHHAARFLSVADPWIIAHALSTNGTVVTHETSQPLAKKVKIPNVCASMGAPCINPFEMLERLGVRLN
jgi:predicted nucleic acid-binding protein